MSSAKAASAVTWYRSHAGHGQHDATVLAHVAGPSASTYGHLATLYQQQYLRVFLSYLRDINLSLFLAGLVKSSPVNNFWQWLGRSNALFVFAIRIPHVSPFGCAQWHLPHQTAALQHDIKLIRPCACCHALATGMRVCVDSTASTTA